MPSVVKFKLEFVVEAGELVSLLYHEPGQAPVALVDNKEIQKSGVLVHPKGRQDWLEIDTDAEFVVFEWRSGLDGSESVNRFFAFGIERKP